MYTGKGGFYAVHVQPGTYKTIGGAIVDDRFHVLDAEGNVIPRTAREAKMGA